MKHLFFSYLLSLFCLSIAWGQVPDLLILNGHLIDPKNKMDQKMDLAVTDGHVSHLGHDLSDLDAKHIIHAEGLIVTPGLIDLHAHAFHGTTPDRYLANSFGSLPPDGFTFESGVTTLVDTGGAGWKNFEVFKRQTIDRAKTRVLAFINIVGNGMSGGAYEQDLRDMDPKLTAMVANKYKSDIIGIKLAHYSGYDWRPTELTVEAGRLAKIPVMIDFGGSQPELSLDTLFLEKLRPGDIFTHVYANVNGREAVLKDDGQLRKSAIEAQKKGLIFDVGHGGASFIFDQAIPSIHQGLYPDTISTDLHTGSMNGAMKDMVNVMSKFLNMNLTLQQVIKATTWKPAQVIQRPELGHLSKGAIADMTLLKLENGDFGFLDTQNKKIKGTQKLSCQMTIKDGQVVYDLNGLHGELWTQNE